MPRNILIDPQRTGAANPNIQFSGSMANTIKLEVLTSGSVQFTGVSGSLLNVTDSLSGSLFAVSDVSGLPIIEVFSDDRVVMGQFNTSALVVTGSRVGVGVSAPNVAFEVSGAMRLRGSTSGYVGLQPAAAAGSTTYTLPSADGTANLSCRRTVPVCCPGLLQGQEPQVPQPPPEPRASKELLVRQELQAPPALRERQETPAPRAPLGQQELKESKALRDRPVSQVPQVLSLVPTLKSSTTTLVPPEEPPDSFTSSAQVTSALEPTLQDLASSCRGLRPSLIRRCSCEAARRVRQAQSSRWRTTTVPHSLSCRVLRPATSVSEREFHRPSSKSSVSQGHSSPSPTTSQDHSSPSTQCRVSQY